METKMTDNDIKKALELCATIDSGNCKKCPCREICNENDGTLTKLTLDLINRQKAEIERLKKNIDGLNIFTKNHIKVIRLQAIKEFAERLKETITNAINTYYNSNGGGYYLAEDVIEDIDDLVKEMTDVEK